MTESAHEQKVVRLLEEIARTLHSLDRKSVPTATGIIQDIPRPWSGKSP